MDDEAPLSDRNAIPVRYLKWLVTALSVTMIAGFIVLVAMVVIGVNAPPTPARPDSSPDSWPDSSPDSWPDSSPDSWPDSWPDAIALPPGTRAEAVTRGPGYLIVVTEDGRVLVFDPDGTTLRQEIAIDR